jgi:hypothetical protein
MKSTLYFLIGAVLATLPASPGFAQSRAVSEGTQTQDVVDGSGAGTKGAISTSGMPEGIAKLKGAMVYVKGGRATRLTGEQKFAEGITLNRNGEVVLQDGRKLKLTEGQMVTLAGELREAPRNIELPAPVSKPAAR